MSKSSERFMRAYPSRWLEEEKIRGLGDDGQREGGIPLEQEAAYWRLCLTQFHQEDGYLPNRRAFLCDAVACPISSYDTVVAPVLSRFFRRTRDGKLYNALARLEWEKANKKTIQAKKANRVRWEEEKANLSSLSTPGNADGDPSGSTDGSSKKENKRESKSEISDDRPSGSPKRRAEYERLLAEPEIKSTAEFWCERLGGKPTLGLLRAIRDLFAVAYDAEIARQAVLALAAAKEWPDEFHPKSQARWCLEHNHAPEYVLRPGIVERLAGDYKQYAIGRAAKAAAQAEPEETPRQRAERRAAKTATPEREAS